MNPAPTTSFMASGLRRALGLSLCSSVCKLLCRAVLVVAAMLALLLQPMRSALAAADCPGGSGYALSSSSATLSLESDFRINGNIPFGNANGSNLRANGQRNNANVSLVTLNPASIPTNASTSDSSATVFSPGNYRTITSTGTISFSAGTYNIKTLIIGSGSTVTLAAGSYFIDMLSVGDGVTFVTGGQVKLYIGSSANIGNNFSFNTAGPTVNGLVFMYGNSTFVAANNAQFRGMIYGPNASLVTFAYNTQLTGLVNIDGWIVLASGSSQTLSDADLVALGTWSGCSGSSTLASFSIGASSSASTCVNQTVTITALTGGGSTHTGYTGTINLSTSTGRGNWSLGSSPTPGGTLTQAAANSGSATYTFVAGDAGVVKLQLSHSLAMNVTVTASDSSAGVSATSSAIQYRDNAFVWSEDLSNRISGSNMALAGRPHDLQIALWRKDPGTGLCSIATNFSGTRTLKLWRSDSGGSWTAPSVVSPALSIPSSRPGSNNISLSFSSGVASLSLATSDVGAYSLNVDDDSLSYASVVVSGSSSVLTVRPFLLALTGLSLGGQANPGKSQPTETVFGAAGAPISGTLAAYRWNAAADANDDGLPDAGISQATATAGGLTAGFNATATLTPSSSDYTPAGGTLGTLNNADISLSNGSRTFNNLSYSEVGSFTMNSTASAGNPFGLGNLTLDLLTFNASGTQMPTLGRFVPAGFVLSNVSFSPRVMLSCSPASSFSYLGELMRFSFTLTAVNASGATTRNYSGSFARLQTGTPAKFNLGAIDSGGTMLNSRVSVSSSSGTFVNGSTAAASGGTDVQMQLTVSRTTAPDGPFNDVRFGIAAQDDDGVGMVSLDLDTDLPANGADRSILATGSAIQLRFGRLRLQNAIGSQYRGLTLPLEAQYWNGSAFTRNIEDSCTRIQSANLSFGNYRKSMTSSDSAMSNSPLTLAGGIAGLKLSAPLSGHSGSYDLSISLGSAATPDTCINAWTPGVSASQGANMPFLQGAWCGSGFSKDPAARASFGLYRGSDATLYQRERY